MDKVESVLKRLQGQALGVDMSLTADVIRLVVSMLVGMVLPRLPLLFFTRFLSMERELPLTPIRCQSQSHWFSVYCS